MHVTFFANLSKLKVKSWIYSCCSETENLSSKRFYKKGGKAVAGKFISHSLFFFHAQGQVQLHFIAAEPDWWNSLRHG